MMFSEVVLLYKSPGESRI